jgi:hypothetical protein
MNKGTVTNDNGEILAVVTNTKQIRLVHVHSSGRLLHDKASYSYQMVRDLASHGIPFWNEVQALIEKK